MLYISATKSKDHCKQNGDLNTSQLQNKILAIGVASSKYSSLNKYYYKTYLVLMKLCLCFRKLIWTQIAADSKKQRNEKIGELFE